MRIINRILSQCWRHMLSSILPYLKKISQNVCCVIFRCRCVRFQRSCVGPLYQFRLQCCLYYNSIVSVSLTMLFILQQYSVSLLIMLFILQQYSISLLTMLFILQQYSVSLLIMFFYITTV